MDSLTTHTDYGSTSLERGDLAEHPLAAFADWLAAAEAAGVYEPNAMVVSTVDADGAPSSRTVLLKGLDPAGFEFVTNYGSRKGRELAGNSAVSLLFPWYSLNRQVIVLGTAAHTDEASSDAYFARRPRGARIAALASEQSHEIDSRLTLEQRVAELGDRYPEGSVIPRPAHWGGVRVTPRAIEFWQGRTSRLHDRIRFTLDPSVESGWMAVRLQP